MDDRRQLLNNLPNHESIFQIILRLLKLAGPMALSYTFSFMLIAVAIIAGRTSKENEEDVNAATTDITAVVNIIVILCSAVYATNVAANEQLAIHPNSDTLEGETSTLLRDGLILAAPGLAAVPIMINAEALLIAMGHSKAVAQLAAAFLKRYALAVPPVLIKISLEQILFAARQQTAATLMGLASFFLGTLSAYLLRSKGFAGIAYGFIIDPYLSCIAWLAYLAYHPRFENFHFLPKLIKRPNRAACQKIGRLARLGLMMALPLANQLLASLVISMLIGRLGPLSLAIQDYVSQLMVLMTIIAFALSSAVGQEVATARSSNNPSLVSRTAGYGLAMNVLIMTTLALIFATNPRLLTVLLSGTSNPEILERTRPVLLITGLVGIPFMTTSDNMATTSRYAGDEIFPTLASCAFVWLGVATACIVGFTTHSGVEGINAAYFSIAFGGATFALAPRYWNRILHRQERQEQRSIRNPPCWQWFLDRYLGRLNPDISPTHYRALTSPRGI